MGQSLFCLQCLKTWFWEFLGPNTCQKRKRKLNITLERLFQFERVTFDHLTIPSIVNRKRVSQTTSTSDIPHTRKWHKTKRWPGDFEGWIGFKTPNCPKKTRPRCSQSFPHSMRCPSSRYVPPDVPKGIPTQSWHCNGIQVPTSWHRSLLSLSLYAFCLGHAWSLWSDQGLRGSRSKRFRMSSRVFFKTQHLPCCKDVVLPCQDSRILRKSLHLCQRRHLHPELRLHGFSRGVHRHLPVFAYMVGAMVPSGHRWQGGGSSSSSRRPLVPESEDKAQAIHLHKSWRWCSWWQQKWDILDWKTMWVHTESITIWSWLGTWYWEENGT